MKKINLSVSFKSLDGTDVKDQRNEPVMLNKQVANLLVAREAKENILQRYELALKLNKATDAVEIEDSEANLIKEAVSGSGATVLLAAQVLKLIQ